MSRIKKTKKLNINLQSSGTFLNINKPKLLSLGKSCNYNNIKVKNNHNISQDTLHNENLTRQTESSSKDEIIKALKEKLTILEKKVQILETESNGNLSKNLFLDLSKKSIKRNKHKDNENTINIKVFRPKINLSHSLNKSKSKFDKNDYINNDDKSRNQKSNKHLNFYASINTCGFNSNLNKFKNKIRMSKSASKYNHFTIIQKTNYKKKIFIDILKRKKIRFTTLENEKVEHKEKTNNLNKSIPRIPKKEKYINKSEKNEKPESKLNELKIKNLKEAKKRILFINKYTKMKSCDLDNKHFAYLKTNFDNNCNNLFNNFKIKLESIKKRTKKLLEFYSDIKIKNNNYDKEKKIK